MAKLNESLKNFNSTLNTAMGYVIEKCEELAKSENPEQLTVDSMARDLNAITGLPYQLLQLAASEVINGSDNFYVSKGRYGGVKAGTRPDPIERKPSEKAQLKSQIESLQAQLAAVQKAKESFNSVLDTIPPPPMSNIETNK